MVSVFALALEVKALQEIGDKEHFFLVYIGQREEYVGGKRRTWEITVTENNHREDSKITQRYVRGLKRKLQQ